MTEKIYAYICDEKDEGICAFMDMPMVFKSKDLALKILPTVQGYLSALGETKSINIVEFERKKIIKAVQ